jgi:hypothetical protein
MIQAPRVTLQILASFTVVIYDCNMFIVLGHCCFLYFFDKNSDLKTFFPPNSRRVSVTMTALKKWRPEVTYTLKT